jgi:hypothetical protein
VAIIIECSFLQLLSDVLNEIFIFMLFKKINLNWDGKRIEGPIKPDLVVVLKMQNPKEIGTEYEIDFVTFKKNFGF